MWDIFAFLTHKTRHTLVPLIQNNQIVVNLFSVFHMSCEARCCGCSIVACTTELRLYRCTCAPARSQGKITKTFTRPCSRERRMRQRKRIDMAYKKVTRKQTTINPKHTRMRPCCVSLFAAACQDSHLAYTQKSRFYWWNKKIFFNSCILTMSEVIKRKRTAISNFVFQIEENSFNMQKMYNRIVNIFIAKTTDVQKVLVQSVPY